MEENRTDDTQKVKRSFSAWLGELREFMKGRFSLDEDKAQRDEVVASVSKGVEFRGVNLWVLIFATMIASLGLNVNSAAVIIGAMLISPIMGPIMGVGLALGINDFELLKKSLRNLALMFIVAIITSTVYFFISPLSSNSSELLARTVPTTYDVLIALFGGLTGMVAVASKEKGNPIAGVAIATALMPPLCTAGFGLAVGSMQFFIGALYLYIINSVMIAFGTFLVAKLLKYPLVEVHTDKQRLTKRIITLITVVIIAPSIYLAYNLVRNTMYENNVNRFVSTEFDRADSQVLRKELLRGENGEKILKVFVIGSPVDSLGYRRLCDGMERYSLSGTQLSVVNIAGKGEDKDAISSDMGERADGPRKRFGHRRIGRRVGFPAEDRCAGAEYRGGSTRTIPRSGFHCRSESGDGLRGRGGILTCRTGSGALSQRIGRRACRQIEIVARETP